MPAPEADRDAGEDDRAGSEPDAVGDRDRQRLLQGGSPGADRDPVAG